MATKTFNTKADIDLKRWCIEMAMHWPTSKPGGEMSGDRKDDDVIGRASKILNWVNGVGPVSE